MAVCRPLVMAMHAAVSSQQAFSPPAHLVKLSVTTFFILKMDVYLNTNLLADAEPIHLSNQNVDLENEENLNNPPDITNPVISR